ncbi:MAG: AcvB/VirJ family lysyl-phosphatidylglycerol hydrolase [Pelobium sp.]
MKVGFRITIFFLILSIAKVKSQDKFEANDYPTHIQYKKSTKPLLIFISGDGGWNGFSVQLIQQLNQQGYPTVSLDSKKYFWNAKNPELFAKSMQQIIDYHLKLWNKEDFSIIGYSFGADVAAFLPNRFESSTLNKLNSLVLISPGYSTGFEVKLMGMLSSSGPTNNEKYKVYPELLKMKKPVLCIFGSEEENDFSKGLKETDKIHKQIIPGGHHYDDDIKSLVIQIVKGL